MTPRIMRLKVSLPLHPQLTCVERAAWVSLTLGIVASPRSTESTTSSARLAQRKTSSANRAQHKRTVGTVGVAIVAILIGCPGPLWADESKEPTPNWVTPSLHCAGVQLVGRVGASILWPRAFDVTEVKQNWGNIKRSWSTAPEFDTSESFFSWDHDPWALNLFAHGFMGSEYYLRYRETHHSIWVSLGMTLAWSVFWEYLIEAWHKQPSGIDLLWTPMGGALFGEGRYRLYLVVERLSRSKGRHVLLYLIDPLGQLERDLLGLRY
jgi:hypothetical protein